jgi:hypothetical protein
MNWRMIAAMVGLGLMASWGQGQSLTQPGAAGESLKSSPGQGVEVAAGGVPSAGELAAIYEDVGEATVVNEIDRLVFARLNELGIKPRLCSDAVFVRRVYLDVIGTLPTAQEVRAFLSDSAPSPVKRARLVDHLLQRPEFADYWAMKWGDILRIKAEFPVNLWPNAAQAYHRWVHDAIASNMPYDQFARQLLTTSGSNFRDGPVNFYRAVSSKTPHGIASAVALTFMGMRLDSWPAESRDGLAAFFSQVGYKPTSEWKEEIVFWDPLGAARTPGNTVPGHVKPTTASADPAAAPAPPSVPESAGSATQPSHAMLPGGKIIELQGDRDPRVIFADWLIRSDNPCFAKAQVNRVWAWLLGRGIIHEPDDIRPGNPPIHPALLAHLEQELVRSGYDNRHLMRHILTSATYQLSSISPAASPEAAANFAAYPVRRLDAEVIIDAINQITQTDDLYTSPIPEPFTFIPADMRAIEIADGSITSQFLTLFGRSARASGMFCERDNQPGSAQSLHMLNSAHIQQKLLRSPRLKLLTTATERSPVDKLEALYLTILSRPPTDHERHTALAFGQFDTRQKLLADAKALRKDKDAAAEAMRMAWLDIAWALINTEEFLYRH